MVTLGLLVFLTDNSNLTSASSFENNTISSKRSNRHRLPSSAAPKPTLSFDCKTIQDKIEINTEYETIRLEAINCGEKIGLENSQFKNKLLTFPVDGKKYSSEYAYLARGENKFVITTGKKSVNVSIFRF